MACVKPAAVPPALSRSALQLHPFLNVWIRVAGVTHRFDRLDCARK
jgi:hypothetical protein